MKYPVTCGEKIGAWQRSFLIIFLTVSKEWKNCNRDVNLVDLRSLLKGGFFVASYSLKLFLSCFLLLSHKQEIHWGSIHCSTDSCAGRRRSSTPSPCTTRHSWTWRGRPRRDLRSYSSYYSRQGDFHDSYTIQYSKLCFKASSSLLVSWFHCMASFFQNPFPPETFGNLLLLYCKYEYYDLAADVLAENAHLTYK